MDSHQVLLDYSVQSPITLGANPSVTNAGGVNLVSVPATQVTAQPQVTSTSAPQSFTLTNSQPQANTPTTVANPTVAQRADALNSFTDRASFDAFVAANPQYNPALNAAK